MIPSPSLTPDAASPDEIQLDPSETSRLPELPAADNPVPPLVVKIGVDTVTFAAVTPPATLIPPPLFQVLAVLL